MFFFYPPVCLHLSFFVLCVRRSVSFFVDGVQCDQISPNFTHFGKNVSHSYFNSDSILLPLLFVLKHFEQNILGKKTFLSSDNFGTFCLLFRGHFWSHCWRVRHLDRETAFDIPTESCQHDVT